jgi:5-formyltetrahydrofolate cyclo-ligase
VVGPGGVAQPAQGMPQAPETPGVILLPVVAWDDNGTRLGRGHGFYDRLLVRLADGCTRIGLAYEFQKVGVLPRDTWDAPLHYVITERRVVRCGPAPIVSAPLQKGGLQV